MNALICPTKLINKCANNFIRVRNRNVSTSTSTCRLFQLPSRSRRYSNQSYACVGANAGAGGAGATPYLCNQRLIVTRNHSNQSSSSSSSSSSSQLSSSPSSSTSLYPTQNKYETKTVILSTKMACDPSHPIAPYVSHSIKNPRIRHDGDRDRDTSYSNNKNNVIEEIEENFHVTFLGTGAGGRPNSKRAPTSTALRIPGSTYLFDAGEGTQRQLAFSGLGIKDMTKIFVTHLHADHVAGLLGVLLMKETGSRDLYDGAVSNRGQNRNMNTKAKIDVYGPVGLYNYLAMNFLFTFSHIHNLDLTVHELVGGDTNHHNGDNNSNSNSDHNNGSNSNQSQGRGQRHGRGTNSNKGNFLGRNFPEFAKATKIKCNTIPRNKDKTWTIQNPPSITQKFVAGRNIDQSLSIRAAEVTHVEGLQTLGYVIEELAPLPKLDVEKAEKLGIKPGPKYRALKNGFSVLNDDGTREVTPDEVVDNPEKKARKIAIIGDAWKIPGPMRKIAHGADLLVHEATLSKDFEKLQRIRGHSTAGMAGKVARDLNCRTLVMNHISGSVDKLGGRDDECENGVDILMEEAIQTNDAVSNILVAHDFMKIYIPAGSA